MFEPGHYMLRVCMADFPFEVESISDSKAPLRSNLFIQVEETYALASRLRLVGAFGSGPILHYTG
jgi:hypothetical protein